MHHSVAVSENGKMYTWGSNTFGGQPTIDDKTKSPTIINRPVFCSIGELGRGIHTPLGCAPATVRPPLQAARRRASQPCATHGATLSITCTKRPTFFVFAFRLLFVFPIVQWRAILVCHAQSFFPPFKGHITKRGPL